ncbi:MAG: hypothetical protein LBN02_01775 [Oscillospiraceae bacterium]|jgi:hypothetical protein|nr:hypothetical protein [Oscillospiraceae bacterium]
MEKTRREIFPDSIDISKTAVYAAQWTGKTASINAPHQIIGDDLCTGDVVKMTDHGGMTGTGRFDGERADVYCVVGDIAQTYKPYIAADGHEVRLTVAAVADTTSTVKIHFGSPFERVRPSDIHDFD